MLDMYIILYDEYSKNSQSNFSSVIGKRFHILGSICDIRVCNIKMYEKAAFVNIFERRVIK
jgi:hypothetical protein